MRSLRKDNHGIATTALMAFGTLIIIAVVWNIMMPSIQNIFDMTEERMTEDGTFAAYEPTHRIVEWTAKTWPILLLGAVIVWMYVKPNVRRQPQYGYGPPAYGFGD